MRSLKVKEVCTYSACAWRVETAAQFHTWLSDTGPPVEKQEWTECWIMLPFIQISTPWWCMDAEIEVPSNETQNKELRLQNKNKKKFKLFLLPYSWSDQNLLHYRALHALHVLLQEFCSSNVCLSRSSIQVEWPGGLDNSVGRAPVSWSKGSEFKPWQKQQENFLLKSQLSEQVLIWCLFHPCVTAVAHKRHQLFSKKCKWQVEVHTCRPLTQQSRKSLTMLFRHNVGTYHGNKVTRN